MVNINLMHNVLHDLNLVRVFLVIWETRSQTVAAQRLNLTQPAVSHALRRLRETFNDPLFVRSTGGMVPTEMATRLHGPLSEALLMIQRAVKDTEHFDPSTAQRVFRVAMTDISEFFFLPSLMGWLADAAPSVHIRVVPLDQSTVAHGMRAGEVDLALGFIPELEHEAEVTSEHLMTDTFVCLVRAGHPILRSRRGTPDLASLKYVYASSTATGHQLAERWLTETGVKRQVALWLGHFTVAPSVVRSTDLAVIFPRSIATVMNEDGAFELLPLPAGHPVIDIQVHTHAHFRGDAGIRWLRDSFIAQFNNRRSAAA
jgi:DNA-binding transcriptional LysR family regulator